MSYDVIELSARLTALIDDDNGFRELVSLKGSAAQYVVDLLHTVRPIPRTNLDFINVWIIPSAWTSGLIQYISLVMSKL